MTPHLCRTLSSLSRNYSSRFQKSPFSYSVWFLFFSSSGTKESKSGVVLADYLIHKHQFSPEAARKAASVKEYLTRHENCDSVLLYLKECGFSKSLREKIVLKMPRILSANIETSIKPKIKIFQDHGFCQDDIADIVSVDPRLLQRSVNNHLEPVISVLKSVLGSDDAVLKVLKKNSRLLQTDLKKTMLPNVNFLKSCGISSAQIIKYVRSSPPLFLFRPESMKGFVRRVDEMGLDRKSKQFLRAVQMIGSLSEETWELKLNQFRSMGFSEHDIVSTFRKQPRAFNLSMKKIKEVTEALLGRRDIDSSFIVRHPELLTYSVERRLKPRLQIFDVLAGRNLLKKKYSLNTFCKIPHKEFMVKFVLPHANELQGLKNNLPITAI